MADNVTFTVAADATPPGGTKAATDELSDGSHAGIAKLAISADGDRTLVPATAADGLLVEVSNPTAGTGLTDAELRATPVSVDVDAPVGQAAMAASIPVTVASDQSAIPISDGGGIITVDGTVTANAGTNLNTSLLALEAGGNLAAVAASASILDDWDETDRAKVNPIAGQAGVQGASGAVSANTQRVVLATDVALPAGTNNIGDVDVLSLPSIPAGNNNIGDVDIASLPNEGQQTMANSISVAVASDQSAIPVSGTVSVTEPVSVDDNGGSLTVDAPLATPVHTRISDGTDVVNVSAAGALLVDGSAVTQPVSGTVTVNQPVEVIGDIAPASPTAGSNPVLIAGYGAYGAPPDVGADADVTYLWTDRIGRQIVANKSFVSTVTSVADNAASTQLLASLSTRLGASITNTSSAALFVKCGTTASLTDFSVRIPQWGYYEVPAGYNGRIDGIWETDPGDGAAKITEFT
jgi:hypothetical protein